MYAVNVETMAHAQPDSRYFVDPLQANGDLLSNKQIIKDLHTRYEMTPNAVTRRRRARYGKKRRKGDLPGVE